MKMRIQVAKTKKDDFTIVDWSRSPFKLHLTAAFHPALISSINVDRASKTMNFRLGFEELGPINDGSVMITYLNDEDKAVNWLNGEFPFLSVEVLPHSTKPPNKRQYDAFPSRKRIQTCNSNMLPKSFAKCSAKRVIPNSTITPPRNTKRYPPPTPPRHRSLTPRVLGICDSWPSLLNIHLLRQTPE